MNGKRLSLSTNYHPLFPIPYSPLLRKLRQHTKVRLVFSKKSRMLTFCYSYCENGSIGGGTGGGESGLPPGWFVGGAVCGGGTWIPGGSGISNGWSAGEYELGAGSLVMFGIAGGAGAGEVDGVWMLPSASICSSVLTFSAAEASGGVAGSGCSSSPSGWALSALIGSNGWFVASSSAFSTSLRALSTSETTDGSDGGWGAWAVWK